MRILKELSRKKFRSKFGSNELCLSFLSDVKWRDGYACIKCKNNECSKGNRSFNKRCSRCGYDESPTANTLFHKVKFGISEAFEMVHVDEFEIGTPKKGEQGRSKSKTKIRIVLAIEIRGNKSGRAYAKVIEDYSCKSLTPIFETHIKSDAKIVTDKWSGYNPLKKNFPKLTQELSDNEANFKILHFQIRNFKNWLRGVHSYCAKEYINQCIQEYFFRFNRLNFRETILEKLLIRMCLEKPITYKSIKSVAT